MKKFVAGLICGWVIAAGDSAIAQVYAKVDTNGVLQGYTVQKNGKTVCKNRLHTMISAGRGVS